MVGLPGPLAVREMCMLRSISRVRLSGGRIVMLGSEPLLGDRRLESLGWRAEAASISKH